MGLEARGEFNELGNSWGSAPSVSFPVDAIGTANVVSIRGRRLRCR